MKIRGRVIVAVALVCASASGAPPRKPDASAAAAAKAACVDAHEEAQSLRMDKKLHAAREKYVACARAECPVVVQKECAEQLEQVEAAAPTVALEALDDKGRSDPDVKVAIDGQVVVERLTGVAVPVEPGEHVFRFERASDGKALEERVLVVEGEKNRKIVADFQTLLPPPPPPAAVAEPGSRPKRVPALAWVAGGVAVAGLGSFAFFSLSGLGAEDDLAGSCAPTCPGDRVSTVKRDYLIADISLGVALVAGVAAVVLALPALTSPSTPPRASSASIPWLPRGRRSP